MNPTTTTLSQTRQALDNRTFSAVQVVQAYLQRIEAHDPGLHAFNEVYAQRALDRAAQVDAGNITGPLAGIPLAIKDNLCTDWGKTTCSSKMLENFQSPYTATAVQKLHDAGAIILGKTNMDEFAMGSSTENSAFGATCNPWDTSRVPGGSSGGSAVAVAADMAAGSLGSDTGGSIRQPAALCGVVGMKPTYGRVSRYGLVAFASSLDQIGPFAHTVEDAAMLLDAIVGHDPKDSTSLDMPTPQHVADLKKPLENLRIGLAKQYLSDANAPEVTAAIEQAKEIYQKAGATLVEVDLPHTEYGIPVYYILATAEASGNLARYDGVHYGHRADHPEDLVDLYASSRAQGFGQEVQRRIMLGTYALCSGYYDAYYLRALKVRRLIKNDFDQAFEHCDAILCPTTTAPAFKAGDKADDPLSMYLNDVYTVNANLAGIPGISLPAGLNDQGLPVAIQLFGALFDDARLLQVARIYEEAAGQTLKRPTMDD